MDYYFNPTTNKAAHIELLAAANKHTPYTFSVTKSTINDILKDSLLKVSDIYRKTDIIRALSNDVTNFVFIRSVTEKAPDKVMQVTGLECFGNILSNPYFPKVYKSNFIPYKRLIFSYLIDGILSKDVGLVSTAAMVLRDPVLNLKTFYPSDSIFRIAMRKQKLPENVEAYNELSKTISYWSGQPYRPAPNKGFRMMDWAVLNNITDSTTCDIHTSKGVIKIELLPTTAPMTVANWVELLKRNYFNGKAFHRVVPNFVIQNGCNRGDGFGALNYTIRSEYSHIYYDRPGMVGMASAGPDTESAQFFITSSATPHLDGRYTIFARVISGQDVVNKINRGDKILKINIK
jgi:cyclophilin family peptidyl-prolyl cis-trans isomerase